MKSFLTPVSIDSGVAGTVGINLKRASSATPRTPGAVALGVDATGNVVIAQGPGPAVLLSDVTAVNTASDVDCLTLAIPAGVLTAGQAFQVKASGIASAGFLGATLNVYVKFGNTKVIATSASASITGASNAPWFFDGLITIRSIGSSGKLCAGGMLTSAMSGTPSLSQGASDVTINTTMANTLTIGMAWANAAATNSATARTGTILSI